ncbi:hypothetical protein FPCIR_12908 [Fusarium pseudocircinatum]|uniref:Uncharacterized protein n=1 Tax=Fusarium pseudocircinatum TaxID=56676 RepID=A0A8H5NRZ9_9HYPO|nr:hypothetical protein FPCIR_12908 [Fusarium pseudocircinatum]
MFEEAILKELSKLNESHSNFVAGIKPSGNARIELEPLSLNAVNTPTVILEVAYTQKAKDLPRLAHEYIESSRGDIKVVVGLDINPNKQSTISMWRSRIEANGGRDEDVYIDHVVDSDPFRTADKAPVNETKSLKLYLDDFTFDELSEATYKDVEISISYGALCHFLDQAEEAQQRREAAEVKENRKARRRTRRMASLPLDSTPEPSEPSQSASDENEGIEGLYRSEDPNQSVQTSPGKHAGPTMETRAAKKQRRT